MALHRLASVTIGVPTVPECQQYYEEFGLAPDGDGWFRTTQGGRQLRIVEAPSRRLVELRVGADDPDDLGRAAAGLVRLGHEHQLTPDGLTALEPVSGVRVHLQVMGRGPAATAANRDSDEGPETGLVARRSAAVMRTHRVRPSRLGHAVVGTPDHEASTAFFVDGLGFKVSDRIKGVGAFMRCSTDHHNVLVLSAPVCFLHHTAWQVADVDDVGRGAFAMLEGHPERHVWGLGRHFAGANFFWYLKDPAGNFSEYYSDLDHIGEADIWHPEDVEGDRGLFAWGPPVPSSFVHPDDLGRLSANAYRR
jgi:catechol 2,3-dioxygenase-like lactoylglutathione lyase family enzyme